MPAHYTGLEAGRPTAPRSSNEYYSRMPSHLRVFILCAGRALRWNDFTTLPKHLVQIDGETLLDRIVRQLSTRRVQEIAVVANDERLQRPGCALLSPDQCRWAAETLATTRHGWNGNTAILLGDVYYTDQAMNDILACVEPLAVFGRPGPSRLTGSCWAEIFALRIRKSGIARMDSAIQQAIRDAERGGRGKLWEIYRSLTGQPLRGKRIQLDERIFRTIDDLTDDVDTPEEWQRLELAISESRHAESLA